jgi:hypothetical protein
MGASLLRRGCGFAIGTLAIHSLVRWWSVIHSGMSVCRRWCGRYGMYDEVLHKYDEEVYFRLRAALSNHSAMQSHYLATHSLLPRQPNRRTTHSRTRVSRLVCSCLSFFDGLPLAALVHFSLPVLPIPALLDARNDRALGSGSATTTPARASALDSTVYSWRADASTTTSQAPSALLARLEAAGAAASTPDSVPKKRRRNSLATPSAIGLRLGEAPLFAPVLMGGSIAEEGSCVGDSPARTPSNKQPPSTISGATLALRLSAWQWQTPLFLFCSQAEASA